MPSYERPKKPNQMRLQKKYAEEQVAQEAEPDEAAINRPNYERPKKPNPRSSRKYAKQREAQEANTKRLR